MWSGKAGESAGLLPGRRVFGPLFLIAATPPAALLLVHGVAEYKGDVAAMGSALAADPLGVLRASVVWPTAEAVGALAAFAAFQIALLLWVPGKTFKGPVTPMGNTPIYTANGLQSFFITLAAFFLLSDAAPLGPTLFRATIVHDLLPQMVTFLNGFALLFCLFLYAKGRWAPSTTDSGTSGYPIFDFYWGTELYPRLLGGRIDVKTLTNCRLGMMGWPVALLSFAAADVARRGDGTISPAVAVSAALQLVYCAKFFWWETGYWASIDIMHDRAGYYICWGCLVWVPALYYSPAYVMTAAAAAGADGGAGDWSWPAAAALFAAGWLAIYLNFDSDRQRYFFRATGGKAAIWGAAPRAVEAKYTTEDGKARRSLLLVSGYWGLSRHFNYAVEIAAALCWSLPAGGVPQAYFYVGFLTILLLDRAYRDDRRCADKYGEAWQEYCRLVPSRIIPGLL